MTDGWGWLDVLLVVLLVAMAVGAGWLGWQSLAVP